MIVYICLACRNETKDSSQKHCEYCGETEWESREIDDASIEAALLKEYNGQEESK